MSAQIIPSMSNTKAILQVYSARDNRSSLYSKVLSSGVLSRLSAATIKNIVTDFFNVYATFVPDIQIASDIMSARSYNQLVFWYTCQSSPLLTDFVKEMVWQSRKFGYTIDFESVALFVKYHPTNKNYKESTINNVARSLLKTCIEFDLLHKTGKSYKANSCYRLEMPVLAWIARKLNEEMSDYSVVYNEAWALFGESDNIRNEIGRLALLGFCVPQFSSTATRIGWIHSEIGDFWAALKNAF